MAQRLKLHAAGKFPAFVTAVLLLALSSGSMQAQKDQEELWPEQRPLNAHYRELTQRMLKQVYLQLKKSYYDPTFHGVDMNARYQVYQQKLEQAPNLGEAYRLIDEYLAGLDDPQTFFIPPGDSRNYLADYRMTMVGDQCIVTGVRPGSDAEQKLHPGDQALSVDGWPLSRNTFWNVSHYLNLLSARGTEFIVRDSRGIDRTEHVFSHPRSSSGADCVKGRITCWDLRYEGDQAGAILRDRAVENGDVMLWKMPIFLPDERAVDEMVRRARKHKTLILDLRDNPGGPNDALKFSEAGQFDRFSVYGLFYFIDPTGGLYRGKGALDALTYLAGSLFDHDVQICTKLARGGDESLVAKSRGKSAFTGELFVLVDSATASAAEVFARSVQLERRGKVMGDRTAGALRRTRIYSADPSIGDLADTYWVSVSDAALVGDDGHDFEGFGLTPDVEVLPTTADVAAGRDPVLARAVELAGGKLDPANAGKLFPFHWVEF